VSRLTTSTNCADAPTLDPFYLYLDLVDHFGKGAAFLLDAAKDVTNQTYQMSLIGVLPILEVQVKDHVTIVHTVPGLARHIRNRVAAAGFACHEPQRTEGEHRFALPSVSNTGAQSAIAGHSFVVQGDPMAVLEQLRLSIRALYPTAEHTPFSQGFLGYIGYDAVHYLEQLPKTTEDDRCLPDIRLQWHAGLIQLTKNHQEIYSAMAALASLLSVAEMEHLQRQIEQVTAILNKRAGQPSHIPAALSQPGFAAEVQVTEDVSQQVYEENVRKAKELIRNGDIFQVVLSKRLRVTRHLHPYVAYDRLRRLNPSPYMFMAEYPDMRLFGASPEVQFRAIGGVAEMKPIAGTSKGRGKTPDEDRLLEARLLADAKERAEHVMLVDLCRNDLGRVCETGSIEIPELMVVEPYSHLFHLVSSVRGRLRADVSVFQALLSTFPAGTLSGAPKIRAMEIIDTLETYRRGPYGGLVGMIDFDANANTAIVIRTVVDAKDAYFVQVGAGIVADSDPTQEWIECEHKAGAVIDVLSGGALQAK